MTHKELRAKIDDSIPFTLHVADGRTYDVPHEDFIMLAPRSTVVVVASEDEDSKQVLTHTIPLLMVSGVTEIAPA